ncbi:MAG: carboxymuconolactone decarboxylase family protein, partial [Deltaproteobacteria bacterium]|nr:carboxymuconolactone decarboxylase family protein [Deltaproteobacteria bacterium]
MANCRIDLLPLDEAREAAKAVEMIPAFAELNIFRAMLHRPKTAKALSDLLVSLLFGGELDDRLRELLIMRIGWTTGSDYEWTQHWRIALEQFGCS